MVTGAVSYVEKVDLKKLVLFYIKMHLQIMNITFIATVTTIKTV